MTQCNSEFVGLPKCAIPAIPPETGYLTADLGCGDLCAAVGKVRAGGCDMAGQAAAGHGWARPVGSVCAGPVAASRSARCRT